MRIIREGLDRFPVLRPAAEKVLFLGRSLGGSPRFFASLRSYFLGGRIGRHPGRDTVVMLVISDLRIDPRVEREARALADAGYNVTVIFPEHLGWEDVDWGDNISFEPASRHSASFERIWPRLVGSQLYKAAIKHRPLAFHAHDLNTTFAAMAAARRTGAHVVCDFHEWFSENVKYDAKLKKHVKHSVAQARAYRWMERQCLKHASALITVCDSIAEAMAEELGEGRKPVVVRNIPRLNAISSRKYESLKHQLGIAPEQFLLLWQGGTGPTRMIEPIIEALALAPGCVFAIRGPSLDLYGEGYNALAREHEVSSRLFLLPPVPSQDVVAAAYGADAGIWTLPALCRNFTHALPNKIFEYIASGLPVLVADYPEARRLVSTGGVGLTFDPYDPSSIANSINTLIGSPALLTGMKNKAAQAISLIDGDQEWQKVVRIYRMLGGESRTPDALPTDLVGFRASQ